MIPGHFIGDCVRSINQQEVNFNNVDEILARIADELEQRRLSQHEPSGHWKVKVSEAVSITFVLGVLHVAI